MKTGLTIWAATILAVSCPTTSTWAQDLTLKQVWALQESDNETNKASLQAYFVGATASFYETLQFTDHPAICVKEKLPPAAVSDLIHGLSFLNHEAMGYPLNSSTVKAVVTMMSRHHACESSAR